MNATATTSNMLKVPIGSNHLFYGDNLDILRERIPDESVDLVYLDPPFNSNANYNVLFRASSGEQSQAQIEAFEDTWHWNASAERAFDEVMQSGNTDVAEMLRAMRSFLKENDMMAYLTMMAVRLLELHRVLKDTGSLYLHCDDSAGHYLKILLDSVFGVVNFRNQIVWRRTEAHNDAKRYGRVTDIILFYSKSDQATWNRPSGQLSDKQRGRYRPDANGRLFRAENLMAAGVRHGETGKPWRGHDVTAKGNHWKFPVAVLDEMDANGLILFQKDGRPRLDGWKVYLDETLAPALQNWWDDITRVANVSSERLGYPTQKPVALLERIVGASSDVGDVVLDPFCGCGTTIHAAQKLGRKWIGIDITHLAISLIEKRLKDAFPGIAYEVHGTPKDVGGAQALAAQDKYQFQWWAVSLVDAIPYGGKKKGADSGIDGVIYFKPDGKTTERAIVSVKGGGHVNVAMVRDLAHVVDREKAKVGIFITLEPPTGPMRTEAVKAGFYQPPTDSPLHHAKVPKIQIFTIAELFEGKKPTIPMVDVTVFKKAAKEEKQQGKLI